MEYLTRIKVKPKGKNTYSNKLIERLLQALASIEKDFVYVDQKHYYRKKSSWLERPFHFELYHQIRLIFKDKLKNYVIQAEIEKSSHNSKVGKKRPDLIFHIPGDLNRSSQLIHIEVKPAKSNDNAHLKEIIDDLKKLSYFKVKLNYNISALVLFGPSNDLSDAILFIDGDDSNDEELNAFRDRVKNMVNCHKFPLFL